MTAALAVVLAGGQGTRVRHILKDLPKPLASVAGRPFLEWQLRYLRNQGFQRVVISTGHHADKLDSFAAATDIPGLKLACVREDKPLGTGGGFLHALRHSGVEDCDALVCNGDSLVLAPLGPLFEQTADAGLLGVRVADAARFGTLRLNEGLLEGFEEKRAGACLVNGGVYFFRHAAIQRFPHKMPLSFEYDVFPALLQTGVPIAVVPCDAPFLDIGTEETLAQADAFIRDNMSWFQ